MLVLPGLGSWIGGERRSGALQVLVAVAGFGLTLVWLWAYASEALGSGSLPEGLGPRAGAGLAGLALFAVSWVWSLFTSLALVRDGQDGTGDTRVGR